MSNRLLIRVSLVRAQVGEPIKLRPTTNVGFFMPD